MTNSTGAAPERFGEDQLEEDETLVEVQLLRFPLPLWARAREHHDELIREMALLALSPEPMRPDVPKRLKTLIDALGRRYGAWVETSNAERDQAWLRGERTHDLVYRVPRSVRDACRQLSALLDEADEFCRAGQQLLTLAAPPDILAFRRWSLDEFVRQIDGHPPNPWPDSSTIADTS
jgi:hypothetical protein